MVAELTLHNLCYALAGERMAVARRGLLQSQLDRFRFEVTLQPKGSQRLGLKLFGADGET